MLKKRQISFTHAILFVLFFCFGLSAWADSSSTIAGSTAAAVQSTQYHAGTVYQGDYISTALYFRYSASQPWMKMGRSNNYLNIVTCSTALARLAAEGQWQGHFGPNGICGSAEEPTLFVLGNRLNYEESLSGQ